MTRSDLCNEKNIAIAMSFRSIVKFLLTGLPMALASAALASTTYYVNGVNGSNSNNCLSPSTACKTIGYAISLATWEDSIMVAAATYKENLYIIPSLKIIGSGAKKTIIDGGGVDTTVKITSTDAHVTLSKLTIQNGMAWQGGGIWNEGVLTINNSIVSNNNASSEKGVYVYGGGIWNIGTLMINHSTISGNRATGNHSPAQGAGIFNNGTPGITAVTINRSTISGNIAHGDYAVGAGGGILNYSGPVTITNSTITGNDATAYLAQAGGGGMLIVKGSVAIRNSTISGNTTDLLYSSSGGAIYNYSGTVTISNSTFDGNSSFYGGGIFNNSQNVILQNNIIAASSNGGNCYGVITSNGYNLSDDNSCNFMATGDLNNIDPMLGPLQNNGGPTQTMALPSYSPAVDAGNPNGCTDELGHLLKTDQRGKPRPDIEDTGGCDMGAYESQSD